MGAVLAARARVSMLTTRVLGAVILMIVPAVAFVACAADLPVFAALAAGQGRDPVCDPAVWAQLSVAQATVALALVTFSMARGADEERRSQRDLELRRSLGEVREATSRLRRGIEEAAKATVRPPDAVIAGVLGCVQKWRGDIRRHRQEIERGLVLSRISSDGRRSVERGLQGLWALPDGTAPDAALAAVDGLRVAIGQALEEIDRRYGLA